MGCRGLLVRVLCVGVFVMISWLVVGFRGVVCFSVFRGISRFSVSARCLVCGFELLLMGLRGEFVAFRCFSRCVVAFLYGFAWFS